MTQDGGVYGPVRQRQLINGTGYQTRYGAASVDDEIIEVAAAMLRRSVIVEELLDEASDVIAAATGAEAGFVTACSASGITVAVAAAMTGGDLARVRRLPATDGMATEVVLPHAHDCDFGARVSQMIRLAGAEPVPAGADRQCRPEDVVALTGKQTAAVVHVTSDHIPPHKGPALDDLCRAMRPSGLPVIADCAAQDDLRGPIAAGATASIYSAHKVRRGLTAGIIAGQADFIAACRLQSQGIGRAMKVGKEAIATTIAVLQRWYELDHAGIQADWRARTEAIVAGFDRDGNFAATVEEDRDGNPVPRARIRLTGPGAPDRRAALIRDLGAGVPAIVVRVCEDNADTVIVDPRSLEDREAQQIVNGIKTANKKILGA